MQSQGPLRPVRKDLFVDAIAAAIAHPLADPLFDHRKAILAQYYASSRVARILHDACYRSRISYSYMDEIRQEVAILLFNKFLAPSQEGAVQLYMQDADKIYNVLHATACNKARQIAEKKSEVSFGDIPADELEEASNDQALTDHLISEVAQDVATSVQESLDHEKTVADFNRRLKASELNNLESKMEIASYFINPKPQQIVVTPLPTRVTSEKSAEDNNNDAAELKLIMSKLGKTKPEMAQMLNISQWQLSSYIYKGVKKVPPNIIENARLLLANGQKEIEDLQKKFEKQTMANICDNWISELRKKFPEKTSDNDIEKIILTTLEIDRTTFWRWRKKNMSPGIRQLHNYDQAIENYLKQQ